MLIECPVLNLLINSEKPSSRDNINTIFFVSLFEKMHSNGDKTICEVHPQALVSSTQRPPSINRWGLPEGGRCVGDTPGGGGIYIGGGVPWHTKKVGVLVPWHTPKKGGLKCRQSPKKMGS